MNSIISTLDDKIREFEKIYEAYLRVGEIVENSLKIFDDVSLKFKLLLDSLKKLKEYNLIDDEIISNFRTILELFQKSVEHIYNILTKYHIERNRVEMELHKLQLIKMYHEYLDQLREE